MIFALELGEANIGRNTCFQTTTVLAIPEIIAIVNNYSLVVLNICEGKKSYLVSFSLVKTR